MLAVLFMAAFFGAAADAEFGDHTASKLFAKGCMAIGGEYLANARVNTVGDNKEYRDAPSHVPYCTAGPVEIYNGKIKPIIGGVID